MTNKQVIEHLKLLRDRTSNLNLFNKIVFDKILQALDKQEPMKVLDIEKIINLVHTNEWTYCGICPKCNEDVYIDDHKNFCGNCGQALDWSDDND